LLIKLLGKRITADSAVIHSLCRDSVIFAAQCAKLGGQVAVKVYSKERISASKLRAIKREAAMMTYMARKK
jgi:hypothetical protein